MSDVTGLLHFDNGGIINKTKIEQQVLFEDKTIMNINASGNKLGNVTVKFPPASNIVQSGFFNFCIAKNDTVSNPYSFFQCKHYNPPASNTIETSYKFIFINYSAYATLPLLLYYGSSYNLQFPASTTMFKVNVTRINGIFVAGQTLPSGNNVNKLCNLVIKKVSDHTNLNYFGRYDISLPSNVSSSTLGYAILNVKLDATSVSIK